MQVWRRPAIGYAGPLGGDFPLVTKEGHNILDVIFTSPIESLGISPSLNYSFTTLLLNLFDANYLPSIVHMTVEVAKILDQIDGVVEHGVIFRKPLVLQSLKSSDLICFMLLLSLCFWHMKCKVCFYFHWINFRCTAIIASENDLQIVDNTFLMESSNF